MLICFLYDDTRKLHVSSYNVIIKESSLCSFRDIANADLTIYNYIYIYIYFFLMSVPADRSYTNSMIVNLFAAYFLIFHGLRS